MLNINRSTSETSKGGRSGGSGSSTKVRSSSATRPSHQSSRPVRTAGGSNREDQTLLSSEARSISRGSSASFSMLQALGENFQESNSRRSGASAPEASLQPEPQKPASTVESPTQVPSFETPVEHIVSPAPASQPQAPAFETPIEHLAPPIPAAPQNLETLPIGEPGVSAY